MAPPTRHARGEPGITLIEVIVVMVIIAILMAIAAWSLSGSRKAANTRVAMSTARSYHDVLAQYAQDNGGAAPRLGQVREWPSTNPEQGPVNRLQQRLDARYMKNPPEPVTSGQVCVTASGAGSLDLTPGCIAKASVRIEITGATTWQVAASWDGEDVCMVTNAAGSGGTLQRC